MDVRAFLRALEKAADRVMRYVEYALLLAGASLAAWVIWIMLGNTDATLLTQLAASAIAALVGAGAMWVFLRVGGWFV